MQKQITNKQNWLRVETTQGTEFVDAAGLALFVRNSDCPSQPLAQAEFDRYSKEIQQYVDGDVNEWENILGYGARMSAPGYLDCTEWCVFDTQEEAAAYLEEMYGDDEPAEELKWFSTGSGRIEIQMTLEQAESGGHQGQCDEDVAALARVPEIKAQLDKIDPALLAAELKEYGAWDAQELADHDQNIQRILWSACCDIREEAAQAGQ